MDARTSDLFMSGLLQGLTGGRNPTSGTDDDDDDHDDEHSGENEAAVSELDENTEAPEEFSIDDEDDLPHPEDDDDYEDASASHT
jgi:hypothetical protein